jgi:hypothetical protein
MPYAPTEVKDLPINPQINPADLISNVWLFQALYTVTKFGIPDLLKENEYTNMKCIGDALRIHPDILYRLMRALGAIGIFNENEKKEFALNARSKQLCTHQIGNVRNLVLMSGYPAHWQAWSNLFLSVRTEASSFENTHSMPFFQFLQQDPEYAQCFHDAMAEVSLHHGLEIARCYPFEGNETVIDIGGGKGVTLQCILNSHPHITGILYELAAAASNTVFTENEIKNRVSILNGNFFNAVPDGGDIYLLVNVLHDWPDSFCQKILENCRRAMKEDAKLLIIELTSPEQTGLHPGKLTDLEMLVLTGGKERTMTEFQMLLNSKSFELARIFQTESLMTLIEAVPIF